jgi:hypothetical protein
MKNIHVLPTDKPSRLHEYDFLSPMGLSKEPLQWRLGRNIYITSDEEIKEGDYSFYPPFGVGKNIFIDGELCFHIESKDGKGSFTQKTYQTLDRNKKIILTTDQSLDNVQAIDDEFLEWFVKNPSCENVDVDNYIHSTENGHIILYNIIIPQEERERGITITHVGKQETLEEVQLAILFHNTYEKLAPSFGYETRADTKLFETNTPNGMLMIAVCKEIIKQQQQGYSEEDMKRAFCNGGQLDYSALTSTEFGTKILNKWFEQFKKK